MKFKNIFILTETGKNYGLGHLSRCISIAQEFMLHDFEPVFYLRGDLNKNIL